MRTRHNTRLWWTNIKSLCWILCSFPLYIGICYHIYYIYLRTFWALEWLSLECIYKRTFITSIVVLYNDIFVLNQVCDIKIYFKSLQLYALEYECFHKKWKQFCVWKTKDILNNNFLNITFWVLHLHNIIWDFSL